MLGNKQFESVTLLYGELLKKGYLPIDHKLVQPYKEEEEVRNAIKNLAKGWRTVIIEAHDHIHLVAEPEGCIFATSISEMKTYTRYSKSFDDKIDFYIICTIINTFLSEIESEYTTKLSIETEGIGYHQIEELFSRVLERWNQINEESNGAFTSDFAIAVKKMYAKWKHVQYSRPNKKITANQRTRMGYIQSAMGLLESDGLIHISKQHKTSYVVYPKIPLYERMEKILSTLDRYQLIQGLIRNVKPEQSETNGSEETA